MIIVNKVKNQYYYQARSFEDYYAIMDVDDGKMILDFHAIELQFHFHKQHSEMIIQNLFQDRSIYLDMIEDYINN